MKILRKNIKLEKYLSYLGYIILLIGHILNLLIIFFSSTSSTQLKIITVITLPLDLMITIILKYLNSTKKKYECSLNNLKAFLYIFNSAFLIVYSNNQEKYKILKYFTMLIINNIYYLIICDDSIIYSLLLAFYHEILLTYLFIRIEKSGISYSEIIISGLFSSFTYLMKKNKEYTFRILFIQKYKFKKFFKYYDTFMSHFNCLHMCYINQKLIFINENFSGYINPCFLTEKKKYEINISKNKYSYKKNGINYIKENNSFLNENVNNSFLDKSLNNKKINTINKDSNHNDSKLNLFSKIKTSSTKNANKFNSHGINTNNRSRTNKSSINKTVKTISSYSNVDYAYKEEITEDFLSWLGISNIFFDYLEIFKDCNNLKDIFELIKKLPKEIKKKQFSDKFNKIGHFKLNIPFYYNNKNNNLHTNIAKQNKKFNNLKEKTYFEVFIRICGENIIDLILYDITEIKNKEKTMFKSDLKHKILAKFAYEFKTPINSIIGLINEIRNIYSRENYENINEIKNKRNIDLEYKKSKEKILKNFDSEINHNEMNKQNFFISKKNILINNYKEKILNLERTKKWVKDNLNVILNLSNYTIFLINDVIQYASQSEIHEIRTNKEIINIKDSLIFCFNILNALLKCSENKVNSIIPILEISKEVKEVKLKSDEIHLKQIILNFISNAVKFTKFGSIKITAKILDKKQFCGIAIIDTGMGIKQEDFNKIFCKENLVLDNSENINKFGSGLGLSICKNIYMRLNHKISFESTIGIGAVLKSQFLALVIPIKL